MNRGYEVMYDSEGYSALLEKNVPHEINYMDLSESEFDNMVKEFFLPKDLNHFCTGCYRCLENREKCPFWEDKKPMDDAIKAADLLILTTPNYCMMPSAPMKAFLDLLLLYGGMQKADWGGSPSEKEYWKSRGWLNGVKPWS